MKFRVSSFIRHLSIFGVARLIFSEARFVAGVAVFISSGRNRCGSDSVASLMPLLPRIAPLLDQDEFRASFERKAPYEWLVRRIPVRVLVAHDTVLAGMADIAANPLAYAIDYEGRRWR